MSLSLSFSQTDTAPGPEWRPVGNTVLALGLASPAGGPVDRVWFSADGDSVFARVGGGQTWRSSDGESWTRIEAEPPAAAGSRLTHPLARGRVYAAGEHVLRSDDAGAHWTNLTFFEGHSILGGRIRDLAVSPTDPDVLVAAGESGVWKSVDGGASWSGLNEQLPNLPAVQIVQVPGSEPGIRLRLAQGLEATWEPGEQIGWRPEDRSLLASERELQAQAAAGTGAGITAAVRREDVIYAGSEDGRIFVSMDRGRSWRESPRVLGTRSILRIRTGNRDGQFAIAVTGSEGRGRVLRTQNGGTFWDDITSDLPPGAVYGVATDQATGAVYVAASAGLYLTYTDSSAAGPARPWTRLRREPSRDVALDSAGNQLYLLLEGGGVQAAMAPHRLRDPRVVSAGDRVLRAAAPGSLLSVIGARIDSARADSHAASVLAAGEFESQVQLPYELTGPGVLISMSSAAGRIQIGLPVAAASPAIFVDKDGNPLLMNADTGLMLGAGSPAHSRSRIQILATGLGRVTPDWPVGLAAPLQDQPMVVADIRAFLDREPLQVTRATLAPGYVGLYLVEVQLPAIVNRGPAELYLEADDQSSNRVRLWVEP